jgi:hypothetical protein
MLTVREHWSSVHHGRPPSTFRVVYCHSVEKLGFQLLDRRDQTLLQAGVVESAGSLSTLGKQAFWCHPLSSKLQLSSPQCRIWHSCSLTEQGLSHCQTWWGSLGLFTP